MADWVLQVEAVSREGRLWRGAGSSVQVSVVDGQLDVLLGHQPLLAVLKADMVTVQTSQGVKTFEVKGGFASADPDFVMVAADHTTVS